MPAIETDTCRKKKTWETSKNDENVNHFFMYDAIKAERGRVYFEIHKYVFFLLNHLCCF